MRRDRRRSRRRQESGPGWTTPWVGPETNDEGTAALQGTTVKLKDEAADLLNDPFATDALTGGLEIGVAKITVNTGACCRA